MRYSRQREAIYEVLKNTKSHPDADWIYEQVRKTCPNISLGTVYRNLKSLSESNRLLTLETSKNSLHYDADTSSHSHFICRQCGAISDIYEVSDMAEKLIARGYGVDEEKSVFYGTCPDCAGKGVN